MNILKPRTMVGLFMLAVFISFVILCLLSFVVFPGDVFRKSTYHVDRHPRIAKLSGDHKISFQLREQSSISGPVVSPPLHNSINDSREFRPVKAPFAKPPEEDTGGNQRKAAEVIQARRKFDSLLLARTLRDHGMHPERAQLLISNLKSKEDKSVQSKPRERNR